MPVSSYSLFAAGRSYLEALKMIRQSEHFPARASFMTLPTGTLAGFTIELHLKAYLLHCGCVAEAQLRRQYGHDLQKLLRDAQANGLTVPRLDELVNLVAGRHGDYSFRYLPDGSSETYLPLPDGAVHILDALDDFVGTATDAPGEAARRSAASPEG